jgi:hypothetical protein
MTIGTETATVRIVRRLGWIHALAIGIFLLATAGFGFLVESCGAEIEPSFCMQAFAAAVITPFGN